MERRERERTLVTAALLALYHTSPGLGLVAPIDAMLTIEPPSPWLMRLGMKCLAEWKMLFTFTAKTLSNSSSVTFAVGYFIISFLIILQRRSVGYLVFVTRTRVIDQDVHSTPLCECGFHQVLPVTLFGDVDLDEMHGLWLIVCDSLTTDWTILMLDC